jgi:hypothetical protein
MLDLVRGGCPCGLYLLDPFNSRRPYLRQLDRSRMTETLSLTFQMMVVLGLLVLTIGLLGFEILRVGAFSGFLQNVGSVGRRSSST